MNEEHMSMREVAMEVGVETGQQKVNHQLSIMDNPPRGQIMSRVPKGLLAKTLKLT